jgi:hypothetical protein
MLLNGHYLVEFLGQLDYVLVVEVTGDVEELISGVFDCLYHDWVRVSGRGDRNASREVYEAIAIHVPHLAALPMGHHKRIGTPIGLGHAAHIALYEFPGQRPREYN